MRDMNSARHNFRRPALVTFRRGSYSETFVSTVDADIAAGTVSYFSGGASITVDRLLPGPLYSDVSVATLTHEQRAACGL
jgi:hypothetical protein